MRKPTRQPLPPVRAIMRWHPETGDFTIFHSEDDVPDGYLPHHPEDPMRPAPAAVEPPAGTPLTREEVVKALRDRGVDFAPATGTKKLYDLLVSHVEDKES